MGLLVTDRWVVSAQPAKWVQGYLNVSLKRYARMLFLLEARTSGLADTRAVLGSSYIPEILRNCLGLVVPSCRWCHTTAAELPQHPQISLLEGVRKPFLVCWREAGLERETSASNQKMAQCNCCMNLDHRRARSKEEWRVAERRAEWPGIFQRVYGGSQVMASVLLGSSCASTNASKAATLTSSLSPCVCVHR